MSYWRVDEVGSTTWSGSRQWWSSERMASWYGSNYRGKSVEQKPASTEETNWWQRPTWEAENSIANAALQSTPRSQWADREWSSAESGDVQHSDDAQGAWSATHSSRTASYGSTQYRDATTTFRGASYYGQRASQAIPPSRSQNEAEVEGCCASRDKSRPLLRDDASQTANGNSLEARAEWQGRDPLLPRGTLEVEPGYASQARAAYADRSVASNTEHGASQERREWVGRNPRAQIVMEQGYTSSAGSPMKHGEEERRSYSQSRHAERSQMPQGNDVAADRHSASNSSSRERSAKREGFYAPIEASVESRKCTVPSQMRHDASQEEVLPPMSQDGGNQEEFEEYWAVNASGRRFVGGWVEYRAHPQVNTEPYWYNEATGELSWEKPSQAGMSSMNSNSSVQELQGDGPEWTMTILELKTALSGGQVHELQLDYRELARRAVAEYEKCMPRVLSWHDYQYITFWFFGGMNKGGQGEKAKGNGREKSVERGSKSFFQGTGAGPELFAEPEFFREVAKVMQTRLECMHPINLTYFVWTFTRANVVVPEFMEAIGHHLCEGRIPMFDRCSLGTMVWNFSKQRVAHDRFFESAAIEFMRPNRLRSIAPRNFQNTAIAFSRLRHQHDDLFAAIGRGASRLLEHHDPRFPKHDRKVLFAYTCKDGSEVLADSFRINGLTVILKAFREMQVASSGVQMGVHWMFDYVHRSVVKSPVMMRDRGDACDFLTELARFAGSVPAANAKPLLEAADFEACCAGAPATNRMQLQQALRRAGSNITLPDVV